MLTDCQRNTFHIHFQKRWESENRLNEIFKHLKQQLKVNRNITKSPFVKKLLAYGRMKK